MADRVAAIITNPDVHVKRNGTCDIFCSCGRVFTKAGNYARHYRSTHWEYPSSAPSLSSQGPPPPPPPPYINDMYNDRESLSSPSLSSPGPSPPPYPPRPPFNEIYNGNESSPRYGSAYHGNSSTMYGSAYDRNITPAMYGSTFNGIDSVMYGGANFNPGPPSDASYMSFSPPTNTISNMENLQNSARFTNHPYNRYHY
ncbi:hypothetical protein F4821DRAFT_239728 [Hypoxylon rubiginosum]|uniref:Uncharacterized protein n=1 Tax=Hypoxylon rubiginosum TaxID=110542 RepID=A0ACC0D001_9PEZI|nr:hypothetical protein F4821DRAFT_239728 [Hypoxylon rubiginosum]